MAPNLSSEIRRKIVDWHIIHGKSATEIATLAQCSKRTVFTVLSYWRNHNVVKNPHTQPRGRKRIADAGDLAYIEGLISARPKIYLDEIQGALELNRGVYLSIATVSRTLHRLSFTNKKVSPAALERNEQLRATWIAAHGDIPREYFMWLDESSVDDLTNHRQRGWARVGRPCVSRDTFIRGQRYSVLPALTSKGIVALDIFEGAVNKERFIQFLREQIAPQLNPYPGVRSAVVMDNCAIHHDEDIRAIIVDECQARLIYLPPYSPDFNPIEQAFHSIKAWLRRHETEANSAAIRPWLIHQARASITAEMAIGWINNCGY